MEKTVLLTGGTGSFGQAFTERLLKQLDIRMVRVFSRDEHKQRLMRERFPTDRVSFYIGDVRDKARLGRVMDGCQWVVHAAALKQAPVGEIEAQEFIKTNVIGSMNVIESAFDCGVEKALLISTDKAVEPINLYGATKMCAEKTFIQADAHRGTKRTRFACTRYGNVAGTSGSVIPLYLRLPDSEPTPVYDTEATRFWITIEEATEFVLRSLLNMNGGEVFVPRLKSVRIMDLAQAIRPGKPLKILGERPGDKRHELLSSEPRYSSDINTFLTIEEIRNHVLGPEVSCH